MTLKMRNCKSVGDNNAISTGRFPPLRMAVLLAATVLLEAGVACWALGAGGLKLPLSGAIPVDILPQVLAGLALALAVFLAPLFFPPPSPLPQRQEREERREETEAPLSQLTPHSSSSLARTRHSLL